MAGVRINLPPVPLPLHALQESCLIGAGWELKPLPIALPTLVRIEVEGSVEAASSRVTISTVTCLQLAWQAIVAMSRRGRGPLGRRTCLIGSRQQGADCGQDRHASSLRCSEWRKLQGCIAHSKDVISMRHCAANFLVAKSSSASGLRVAQAGLIACYVMLTAWMTNCPCVPDQQGANIRVGESALHLALNQIKPLICP